MTPLLRSKSSSEDGEAKCGQVDDDHEGKVVPDYFDQPDNVVCLDVLRRAK